MARHIHRGPSTKLLVLILCGGALAGLVVWLLSEAGLTTRPLRTYIKGGLAIASIIVWLIVRSADKRTTASRQEDRTRRRAEARAARSVPVIDVSPAVPAIPAPGREPVPAPQEPVSAQPDTETEGQQQARWQRLQAALPFQFHPGPPPTLEGEFGGYSIAVTAEPIGARAEAVFEGATTRTLTAEVGEDGSVAVVSSSDDLSARFLEGDAPTWLGALGSAELHIGEGRAEVHFTATVTDADVVRGMLEAAIAGARAASQ